VRDCTQCDEHRPLCDVGRTGFGRFSRDVARHDGLLLGGALDSCGRRRPGALQQEIQRCAGHRRLAMGRWRWRRKSRRLGAGHLSAEHRGLALCVRRLHRNILSVAEQPAATASRSGSASHAKGSRRSRGCEAGVHGKVQSVIVTSWLAGHTGRTHGE
jgi:hypothetical protein